MKLIVIILTVSLSSTSYSQSIDIEGHRRNIIVIGSYDKANDKISFIATGFLILVDSVFHLVTAKHVITNNTATIDDSNLYAFYYLKSGLVVNKKITDIKSKYNVKWLVHSNPNVDIAVLPFDIDAKDNLRVVPQESFIGTQRLYETYDVYYVSFHPDLVDLRDLNPIFRTGSISRINNDKTILLDAFAFPGNSGSPVFLKHSPVRYDTAGYHIGTDELGDKFIGIIGSYIPYEDVAISRQTNQPRVRFQENSGIAIAWSADYLISIIKDPATTRQIKYLKENFK
jgi:hypothetical protein